MPRRRRAKGVGSSGSGWAPSSAIRRVGRRAAVAHRGRWPLALARPWRSGAAAPSRSTSTSVTSRPGEAAGRVVTPSATWRRRSTSSAPSGAIRKPPWPSVAGRAVVRDGLRDVTIGLGAVALRRRVATRPVRRPPHGAARSRDEVLRRRSICSGSVGEIRYGRRLDLGGLRPRWRGRRAVRLRADRADRGDAGSPGRHRRPRRRRGGVALADAVRAARRRGRTDCARGGRWHGVAARLTGGSRPRARAGLRAAVDRPGKGAGDRRAGRYLAVERRAVVPGLGGAQYEDDVLIGPGGAEVLTVSDGPGT